jgi:hypothetical protein
VNQKSQKSNNLSDKLDALYKELFEAQFIREDQYAEQDIINRIRRLEAEEGNGQMEAYRESVRADTESV